MNVAACTILRHQPTVRHGLGISATWCDCCGLDVVDTHSRPGAEPTGVPGAQRADALPGGPSAGDSAGSERAIARATPGRTDSLTRQSDPPLSRRGVGVPPASVSPAQQGAELAPAAGA